MGPSLLSLGGKGLHKKPSYMDDEWIELRGEVFQPYMYLIYARFFILY